MAHLPDDLLPSQFDVVVNGTGVVQSLLAAALARAGKTVLHIDGNSYYGESWGTLMHRELDDWIGGLSQELSHDAPATPPELAAEERLIVIKQTSRDCRISNLVQKVHEKPQPESDTEPPSGTSGQAPSSGDEANEHGSPLDGNAPLDGNEQRLTWESLGQLKKRFNYDITAKLLYCRGGLVSILTESNCSRYVEFKAVNKVYTHSNGRTEPVPCSRADVFSSQVVSMLEKRKMMKFLTFCSDFEKQPEEYEELVSIPFAEFLRLKDLTQNLIQYIVYSIAMVTEDTPTLQGLQATQLFLNSLGRFGNAPFLYPIFGVGELPQAFCRMCAVFGGVYCLRRHVQSLVVAGDKVTGVVCSHGQKISCSYGKIRSLSLVPTVQTRSVISSAALMKDSLNLGESISVLKTSHGVFVTDGPVQNTENTLALITIPPQSLGSGHTSTIRCLQLDPSTNNTVQGTYMVHMACISQLECAQQDLELAARNLFKMEDLPESNSSGPRLLWSLCYNLSLCGVDQSQTEELDIPSGVYLTSDPDTTMCYERAVKEARQLFEKMCPGEPFLPPPPEQEDIIVGDIPVEESDNEPQHSEATPIIEDIPVEEGANEPQHSEATPIIEDNPVEEGANKPENIRDSDETANVVIEDNPVEEGANEPQHSEATPIIEDNPVKEGANEPRHSEATPIVGDIPVEESDNEPQHSEATPIIEDNPVEGGSNDAESSTQASDESETTPTSAEQT